MEEKTLKATVCSVETVFKESAEVPVDIEFNLPDNCPEISRILKCRAVPRVSSKSAANRGITVDGSVTVTVIYADGENTVNSYEYQYPFSKSFESNTDTDDCSVAVRAKSEYINCRAVTERKIDIHGAVSISAVLTCRRNKEIINDIKDENIKTRRKSVSATVPVAEAEKYVILEEEIEAGASRPDIKCLIRYDAVAFIDECKLLAEKAIVKGTVSVNLLYRTRSGEIEPLSAEIPFSQLIEVSGALDNQICEADAYIAYLEVKPKFGTSGEARAFALDGKLRITVKTFTDEDIELIIDAYSRKYEAQISSEDICINKLILNVNDTFTCKDDIDFKEPVSKICDIRCEVKEQNTRNEGECLYIYGTVGTEIIALDDTGAPRFFEKSIDFEYTYKIPAGCQNVTAVPHVTVKETNYTLQSENTMEIRAQMAVSASVYECRKTALINSVTVDENKPIKGAKRPAMTVYFAEAGESVWDISRRYLADAERVMAQNKIKDDNITKRQMILIV